MDKVWNWVERWLIRRPHSQWEIEMYLKQRVKKWAQKYKEELEFINAGQLYSKLYKKIESLGLVDDKKFAEWWAFQRVEFKRFGSIRMQAELAQKRVPKEIVKPVIEKVVLPVENGLAKEWLNTIKSKQPDWQKAKVIRYLASKGFPYSVIEDLRIDF